MTIPVLTFFNNKGGVGKTSLVYHLAWMMSEIGHRVLACDLDPQANLTSMFLSEDKLEGIYADDYSSSAANTVFRCVRPLMQVGDLHSPELQHITSDLSLVPGDLELAGFEDTLSAEWPNAPGSSDLYRPFRILTAFSTIMQSGAVPQGDGCLNYPCRCWAKLRRDQSICTYRYRLCGCSPYSWEPTCFLCRVYET